MTQRCVSGMATSSTLPVRRSRESLYPTDRGNRMAQVVGVHGIAQEQLGRRQMLDSWRDALADGIEVALDTRTPPVPSFDIAYYGDLFLSEAAGGAPATKSALIAGSNNVTDDEVEFLEAGFAEVAGDEEAPPPDKGFAEVPAPLRPLLRGLATRYDMKMLLVLVTALRQVRVYLDDDALAARIRQRVLDAIEAECDVLIGHSLGSVVAFETLALNPDVRVGALITAGSPLSMKTVATRLRAPDAHASGRPLPGPVQSWVNIFNEADPVTAGGRVGRIWPAVLDYTVDNGNQPHAISRYLSKRICGQSVLAGITPIR